MTKIQTKTKGKEMHSHINRAYLIIDSKLPDHYVNAVKLKSSCKDLSSGIIRNIRNRKTLYPINHIHVINALVEVANDYQKELEKLTILTP